MHKAAQLIAVLTALFLSSPVFADVILPERSRFVKDSYIVTFKAPNGTEQPVIWSPNKANHPPFPEHSSGQSKTELEATLGTNGKIKYIFDTINSIAILMDAQEAQRLSNDPRVLRVDQEGITTLMTSGQPIDYSGIWQDQNRPERYYSIHVKENTLILIDLAELETNSNALQSSYSGALTFADGIASVNLAALSKNRFSNNLLIMLESGDKGLVNFICNEPCTASYAVVSIRKIF